MEDCKLKENSYFDRRSKCDNTCNDKKSWKLFLDNGKTSLLVILSSTNIKNYDRMQLAANS